MSEPMPNRNKPPCKGCPDRKTACSDHCQKPEYLKWREEQTQIKKNREAYYSHVWTHGESDAANYRCGKRYK